MKTRALGARGPVVSAIGLGCMGMSAAYGARPDEEAMIRLLHDAVDQGITLFDTAQAYGPFHNEGLLGRALAVTPGQLAIAWVLARRPWTAPIPGTTKAHRLAENIAAADIELDADELARIDEAVARIPVEGGRYSETEMEILGR